MLFTSTTCPSNILTRLNEHGTHNDQPMSQNLKLCEIFFDKTSLMFSQDIELKSPVINFSDHIQIVAIDNFNIIDQCAYSSQLLFSEEFFIKKI